MQAGADVAIVKKDLPERVELKRTWKPPQGASTREPVSAKAAKGGTRNER